MRESRCGFWFVVAVAAVLQAAGCASPSRAEADKAAIARVIDDNIGWFRDKDFDRLFGTITNGPDLFMYQLDEASTIRGFDQFKKYSAGWRNPDVRYAGHRFTDRQIHLSGAGDVAWFSCRLEDCARVKDGAPRCFTTRYTGVLERRNGRWLLVQQHFSLPAEAVAADWAARTAHPPASAH
jgi:ketosteroid isomerase-like protein